MVPRMSLRCGILLSSVLFILHAFADQPAPGSPVSVLIPIPRDIQCSIDGISVDQISGEKASPAKLNGFVKGLTCWPTGLSEQKVDIPLSSTEIEAGFLTTRDFGKIKIVSPTSANGAFGIEIRREKVPSLRAFLQKQEAAITTSKRNLAQLAARAWTLIKDADANPAELSSALDAAAKAGLLEQTNAEGVTLLNKAAQLGLRDACRQLADLGANPNATDGQGRSALYFVAANLPSLYDLLVSKGGNENAPDAKGITPAEVAGRFVPWKDVQELADEGKVKELLKPSGPFASMQFRMTGETLADSKSIFPMAAASTEPAKIRLSSIGAGHVRVSTSSSVQSISGSEKCLMGCLLLPFGSEVELDTPVYLWGKLFQPGTLQLQQDGIHFKPSNGSSSSDAQAQQGGNQTASGSIAPGANFSSGTSFSFVHPSTTAVAINPSTASLRASDSVQFRAMPQDNGENTIIWSITPQFGEISSNGLYGAPSVIDRTQQVTVTATSTQDPTKSATATITLISK
jgi:hypothetical protein